MDSSDFVYIFEDEVIYKALELNLIDDANELNFEALVTTLNYLVRENLSDPRKRRGNSIIHDALAHAMPTLIQKGNA